MTTLSPSAKAVIDAARGGDDPTSADRARVRAAVFAAIGAGAASGTAHAASGGGGGPSTIANASSEAPALATAVASPGRSGLGLKVAGGMVLVGALVIGGYLLLRSDDAQPQTYAVADDVADQRAATPVLPEVPDLSPAQPSAAIVTAGEVDDEALDADADDEVTELAPDVIERRHERDRKKTDTEPAPAAAAEQPKNPVDESNPAHTAPSELELLGKAKRAENKRDWATALALAAELRRLYANGKLVIERVALEARVLCKSGNLADGQAKADKFLARWPKAPQAASLRRHCQLDD